MITQKREVSKAKREAFKTKREAFKMQREAFKSDWCHECFQCQWLHQESSLRYINRLHCSISKYSNEVLQHTATHCNTLQHTATHCNTLIALYQDTVHLIATSPTSLVCEDAHFYSSENAYFYFCEDAHLYLCDDTHFYLCNDAHFYMCKDSYFYSCEDAHFYVNTLSGYVKRLIATPLYLKSLMHRRLMAVGRAM